jgi:hypothetical protein
MDFEVSPQERAALINLLAAVLNGAADALKAVTMLANTATEMLKSTAAREERQEQDRKSRTH